MALDPNWRPDGPYIMFVGRERMTTYDEGGTRVERENPEAIMFFQVVGAHMNEESINMLWNKGWNRIVEYGNFPNKPKFNEFAEYLDRRFPREQRFKKDGPSEQPRRSTGKGSRDSVS